MRYKWRTIKEMPCKWCLKHPTVAKYNQSSALFFCSGGCGYRALIRRGEMFPEERKAVYGGAKKFWKKRK